MIDLRKVLSEAGQAAALQPLKPAPPVGPYPDTPMEEYLSWDAVSAGLLKTVLREGPAFARWSRQFKLGDRPALQLGTAAHAAVLEPEHFEGRFQLRETKGEGVRARMAELVGYGVTLCTQTQLDLAACMAAQVHAHSRAAKLLEGGDRELAVVFELEVTASNGERVTLLCKLRIDLLRRDIGVGVDLKTARDVSPRALSRSFVDYGYDLSKAWYEAGLTAAGLEVDTYTYVCVENELPCRVRLYELGPASTDLGRLKRGRALVQWVDCLQADAWPVEDERVQPLELPEWEFERWGEGDRDGGTL